MNVQISAHRGRSGPGRVSLIESYLRAIELGVDFVEFDVRRTHDDVQVIWHDEHLPSGLRLSDASCREYMTEVGDQALTVNRLLTEVAGRVQLQLDLKETGYEDSVVRLALEQLPSDQFAITTLEDESVRAIKERYPSTVVGLSLGRDLRNIGWPSRLSIQLSEMFPGRRVRRCMADFVSVHHCLASRTVLSWCARHGVPAWVWTVDEEDRIRNFLDDPRVAVLITNRPDVALAVRSRI